MMKRIVEEEMSDGTIRYVVEKQRRFLWLTWFEIDTMIVDNGSSYVLKQCIYDNVDDAKKRCGIPSNEVMNRKILYEKF